MYSAGISFMFMIIALIMDFLIFLDSDKIEHNHHLEGNINVEKTVGEENLLKQRKMSEEIPMKAPLNNEN